MRAATPTPFNVFISFTTADEAYRRDLETHLAVLQRSGMIRPWHTGLVQAGEAHVAKTTDQLKQAHIILLLVSADYLAADHSCCEMDLALARHDTGEAKVIPLIVRPCSWEYTHLSRLDPLPENGVPVSAWGNRDAAWAEVERRIRVAIEQLAGPLGKPDRKDSIPLTIMTTNTLGYILTILPSIIIDSKLTTHAFGARHYNNAWATPFVVGFVSMATWRVGRQYDKHKWWRPSLPLAATVPPTVAILVPGFPHMRPLTFTPAWFAITVVWLAVLGPARAHVRGTTTPFYMAILITVIVTAFALPMTIDIYKKDVTSPEEFQLLHALAWFDAISLIAFWILGPIREMQRASRAGS